MPGSSRETFFRPDEITRERVLLPAQLYNQCRLMLARSDYAHLFVPVRSMQIQAVIDRSEVIFADNQAYAVQDGEGGRLIRLAWEFRHAERGSNLSQPAPIELVHYVDNSRELHERLVGEMKVALDLLERRQADTVGRVQKRSVIGFPDLAD